MLRNVTLLDTCSSGHVLHHMLMTCDCIRFAHVASDLSYFDLHAGILYGVPRHPSDLQSRCTQRDKLVVVALMSR